MKIYSFPGSYNRNHDTTAHHYEHGTGALKRDRHDFDRVEISPEARKRFEAHRVTEIERARTIKLARSYQPTVRRALSEEGDDITRARRERIAELQQSYGDENTIFSDDILRVIAKILI